MQEWLGSKAASVASYLIGSGLLIGDAVNWLDNHAGAGGFALGVITYLTNVYFRVKQKNL